MSYLLLVTAPFDCAVTSVPDPAGCFTREALHSVWTDIRRHGQEGRASTGESQTQVRLHACMHPFLDPSAYLLEVSIDCDCFEI